MKVGVLVPVYNAERYLRECLDSLLAQEGVDVFCCDDGSSDGSAAILAEYAAKTGRVHVVRQANAGVSAARNRLIDELPDGYDAFAFCDADDCVAPGMYAALAEAMERTGADVAESGWSGPERVVDDMSVYWLRRTSPGAWINVWNKLYRRSAVGDVRFREGLRFEEDFFFNREVNARIRRKVLVPGSFYAYRNNPNSATSSLNHRRYYESTMERIRLTHVVFLDPGLVPKAVEPAYRAELAKDAYRMCIRKNLKKNGNAAERRELFALAGEAFARLEREHGFRPVGLNPVQRLVYLACRRGRYMLARMLVAIT
jgi:glycosyltransferase involved in cell wall biosynthesis